MEILVIGAGTFGTNLIESLEDSNVDVLLIDNDPEKLQALEGIATQIICADATKEEVLSQLEITAFDGAILTMGHSTEATVKIIMHLKEMGMPFIMAKATSDFEGRIFRKLGADRIIFPEAEVGLRVGREIAVHNLFGDIDVGEDCSISEIPIPRAWIGKTLAQINPRKTYEINIILVRRDDKLIITPSPHDPFVSGDTVAIIGANSRIKKLQNEVLGEEAKNR